MHDGKKLYTTIIVIMIIMCSYILSEEKSSLTQLVGNNNYNIKKIIVIYMHPEPEFRELIYEKIKNLESVLNEHGYKLIIGSGSLILKDEVATYDNIFENIIEPEIETLKELAASFKNIKDCEVFVLFSHGNYTRGILSGQGPAIAYYRIDSSIRSKIIDKLRLDPLGIYIYPANLESDSATPQNEYKGALILDSSALQMSSDYKLSDDFLNNGIAFLMTCNSNYYWNVFEKKGAKVIFYACGAKKTEHLSESFIRIITAMLGEGSIPTKSGSANIIPYYIDTHEAYKKTGVIGAISIYPEEYDYKSSRVLLRSPHIEELIIYNLENSEDIYYHYKYGGSRKYNPEESYPGDSILKIKGNNSTDSILNTGICRKGIPKNSRVRIEILFSKPHSNTIERPPVIDVKLKYFVPGEEGYQSFFVDLKKTDTDKNSKLLVAGSDHWAGDFDLTEKKHQDMLSEMKIGLVPVNLLISYKDPQKKDKDWFLDSTGDGKWMEKTKVDGERVENNFYDNNHWFMVGSEPVMTVSSMEIDELHLPFQQAPPDGRVNMQPVMLNGEIALPENFSWQEVYCDDKTGVEHDRCIYNINQHNYNDNLEPTYYLNNKMLRQFTFDPKSVKTVDELIDALAPVFHAELSDKNVDLESLVADGSIKDYIDIYLEVIPYQPGEGQMARNHAGPPMEPVKIDNDMYYAFFFKSAANNIMIALPLKSIFLDRYPSLPDGNYRIRVESTNGREGEDKVIYDSRSLQFFKDFNAPVKDTAYKISIVKDDASGFTYDHFGWYPATPSKTVNYYDMAANSILVKGKKPADGDSPKSDKDQEEGGEDIMPDEGGGDDSYLVPDDNGCIQIHSSECTTEDSECTTRDKCNSYDFKICISSGYTYATTPKICSYEGWLRQKPKKECSGSVMSMEEYVPKIECNWDELREAAADKTTPAAPSGATGDEEQDKGGEPGDRDDSAPSGDGGGRSGTGHQPSRPLVTDFKFVVDKDAPYGLALDCEWEDADGDIAPERAYVAMITNKSQTNLTYKYIDIYADLRKGNFNDAGFVIKNSWDLIEGEYWIKVHGEDRTGLYDNMTEFLSFKAAGPVIGKPEYDKDNRLIKVIVSDEGTPIDKLDIQLTTGKNYREEIIDRKSARLIIPIPDDKKIFNGLILKITDLPGQSSDIDLYRDLLGPAATGEHNNDKKEYSSLQNDIDFESGIDIYRTEFLVDGEYREVRYDAEKVNGQWRLTYNTAYLKEGTHTAYLKVFDYAGNSSTLGPKEFTVFYPPVIQYFNYNSDSLTDLNKPALTAFVYDRGGNLEPDKFILKVDSQVIDSANYSYDTKLKNFNYYPKEKLTTGEHTAELTALDSLGNTDSKTIEFTVAGLPDLQLGEIDFRDIEGNSDGMINEGERIYLNIELKNSGDAISGNVWGELINKSRYIKGVAEARARFGFIDAAKTAANTKPFEFVVNDKVFESGDIDYVDAEFILKVSEERYDEIKRTSSFIFKEFPITLHIFRLDPALAQFRLIVDSPAYSTTDPNYNLKGGWQAYGTSLKELSAEQVYTDGSGSEVRTALEPVRDDAQKTFSLAVVLKPGDNRFTVTAISDAEDRRTVELTVRLKSEIDLTLEPIGSVRDPQQIVRGTVRSTNSGITSVEIFVNDLKAGDAMITGENFSLPVVLQPGANLIQAIAHDNLGDTAVKTISADLLSAIELTLEPIADTNKPEQTVRGTVKSYNATISQVEVFLNGRKAGNAFLEGERYALNVTLQSGENVIRVLATDSASNSAEKSIKVMLEGSISISWGRANYTTIEDTMLVCGRYMLTGDTLSELRVDLNDMRVQNTVIDRERMTFCSTIRPNDGANTLRAVAVSAGGVQAEALATVTKQGAYPGLSITIDPVTDPTMEAMQTITGRFTLGSADPYTIEIQATTGNYTPTIDHAARTFTLDLPLETTTWECECCVYNWIDAGITQNANFRSDFSGIDYCEPVCSGDLTDKPGVHESTGIVEGRFELNMPGAHVASITLVITTTLGTPYVFNVLTYDEAGGTWQQYIDITPDEIEQLTTFETTIIDTLGNSDTCTYQDAPSFGGISERNRINEKGNKCRKQERESGSRKGKREKKINRE